MYQLLYLVTVIIGKKMKKLIYLTLLSFIITSCIFEPPSCEHEDIIAFRKKSGEYTGNWGRAQYGEFNGHRYILFIGGSASCVIHDPDCPCDKHKEESSLFSW